MTAIGRIILAALLLAALGCGPKIDLEGTWIGYRNLEVQPGTDPVLKKNLSKVELHIDKRGRFELFERGLRKTGSVSYSEGKANLEVQELMNGRVEPKDAPDYENMTLEPSGENALYRQPAVDASPVTLSRKAA
jgi:hypothetical protein